MAFVSGWGGRVKVVSGTALPVLRWQVNATCELVDATAGPTTHHTYVQGYNDLEANFECLWDTNLDLLSTNSASRIRPGDAITVWLYFDQNNVNRSWLFTNFLIASVEMDDEVRGVVKYQVTGKQSGDSSYSYPTN